MIYKILRNRLKQRTNKNFVKWLAGQKSNPNNELHHLLKSFMGSKKQNDYLLAEIDGSYHREITYKREPTDDEFIIMFIQSLENLFNYIEYLESKK